MTAAEVIRNVPPANHFIAGAYTESSGAARIEVRSPAFGKVIGSVPDATQEDVDRAVAAARESFESGAWKGKDPSEKERILWRLAALMEEHKDDLAGLESMENGEDAARSLGAPTSTPASMRCATTRDGFAASTAKRFLWTDRS